MSPTMPSAHTARPVSPRWQGALALQLGSFVAANGFHHRLVGHHEEASTYHHPVRQIDEQLFLSASDLHNFLECPHLTQLDLAVVQERLAVPNGGTVRADLIARKGDEHEVAYLESLKDAGKDVVEFPSEFDAGAAAHSTLAAMQGGSEVIYQGAFLHDGWIGYADFLLRIGDRPSDLGSWSYEVADTKLARRTKPYFLLQLCFYSEQVARLQGREPERVHVILGTREQHSFRIAEFNAYYRRIKQRFLDEVAASPLDTYPHPVPHCELCRWAERCDAQRIADDHLCLVAGMRRDQSLRMGRVGITTLEQLALAPSDTDVPKVAPATFETLHDQARLQLAQRRTGEPIYELLEPEERRGFALLPPPSEGDLFFDMEGDPLYENGLEYLFGVVSVDEGVPRFHVFWGHDRAEEKRAFERLIDFVYERLERYPDLHVYHYSHYEPTALKRLMGLHSTREEQVDDLLRKGVLVDLYKVVKQGIRISQPGYGIKKVEAFYMEQRDTAVTEGGESIVAYEEWIETGEQRILDEIAEYNEEDCVSTLKLRDWLLGLRGEAEAKFGREITWRQPQERERKDEAIEEAEETDRLRAALLADVPDDLSGATNQQRALWLMAQLVDYHRREDKPVWWVFFERQGMSADELVEDAESIGDLHPIDGVEPEAEKKSLVYTLEFPVQEHRLRLGDNPTDPATGGGAGSILWIDDIAGRLRLSRSSGRADDLLPRALIPGGPYATDQQRAALRRLVREVQGGGFAGTGPYRALRDMLLRALPRVEGLATGAPLQGESVDLEQAKTVAAGLDDSYLFIQGPPGSGKTWTGARLIVHLMRAGKRVGVTSNSHKAIQNLLEEVERVARAEHFEFRGLKKSGKEEESKFEGDFIESSGDNADFPPPDDVQLIAGTAWLFAREEMDQALDHLFIDEAGQVALADALAVGTAARNIVLLGDPLQLAQVSQGVHPGNAGASVLEHLLGDEATIPPERGLFLDLTRRMHPDVCGFISDVVYAGRLTSIAECASQSVESGGLTGTGLRYLPVEHEANSRSSPEEADVIAGAISEILADGRFTDQENRTHPLTLEDILVVTPYNAQVRCLRERLPDGARIGTVDKFQGQEAPVVFFSMATSSGAEIPRNVEFLFSRNRLNVAISRAQCLAVLLASPKLLHIRCRNVDQLRMVSALCRLVEVAEVQQARVPG
jgi:predicted RecB family nuclease